MRRIGDLFEELGFNPDAPIETQKAFVRHLTRAAAGQAAQKPSELKKTAEPAGQQLSFDPEILGLTKSELRLKNRF